MANDGTGDEVLLRNDGSGSFAKLVLSGSAGNSWGIAWADYDGDGDLDLAVANAGEDSILLRNDAGSFSAVTATGTNSNTYGVAWGPAITMARLTRLVNAPARSTTAAPARGAGQDGPAGTGEAGELKDFDNDGGPGGVELHDQDETLLRNDLGGTYAAPTAHRRIPASFMEFRWASHIAAWGGATQTGLAWVISCAGTAVAGSK